MSRSPNFVVRKQVNFQEGEQSWLLPTTCSSTKLKPRTVFYQEGENDEDMTPLGISIEYMMSSFIYLYNNFWYNSLGSTCTCHYLIVDSNMTQTASLSKLNFQYVVSPIVLYWEGHNSSI